MGWGWGWGMLQLDTKEYSEVPRNVGWGGGGG